MQNKQWKLGAAAGLASIALLFGSVPAAQADPAPGTNPVLDGAGSDTTQDVMNALATVIKTNNGQPLIASYDAGAADRVAAGQLSASVKPGEKNDVAVPRPNGSGQGRAALIAAIDGTKLSNANGESSKELSRDVFEFARSSSGPGDKVAPNGRLAYIPFGVDGVTYAVKGTSFIPRNLPVGTKNDAPNAVTLRNIYLGNVKEIKGTNGQMIKVEPLLPQTGSGTRDFFVAQLGLSKDDVKGVRSDKLQENDGAALTGDNQIIPYSIGQYSAQSRASYVSSQYPQAKIGDRRNGAVLGFANGVNPQNSLKTASNTNFPMLRPVFNIVENAAITQGTPQYNAALAQTFVGPKSSVITAKSPGGNNSVVSDYGFADIPANGIRIQGTVYTPGQIIRSN